MKSLTLIILILSSFLSFSQDKEEQDLAAQKKANDYVFKGNELVTEDDYVSAEMEYRKAISEQPSNIAGAYNLGNTYYNKGKYEEALYRQLQAAKNAESRADKHKAFHNIGNILMKNKKCKEAVEAYKNALRNDPSDDETRYNLGLAKECAQQQKDDNKDDNKDKDKDKKEDKQDKDKEGQDKENQDQQGDQDKKEGEDQKDDKGQPKDDKQDQGKGDEKKEQPQQPQPKPGQLSPQQIKNLLEAMNNQEQKVQEKMNAEKQKGVKIRTDKDW